MTFGGRRVFPRTEEKSGRALHQVRPQGHGNHTGARVSQPRTAGGLARGVAGKRRKAHGPQPRATRAGAEEGRGQAPPRPWEVQRPRQARAWMPKCTAKLAEWADEYAPGEGGATRPRVFDVSEKAAAARALASRALSAQEVADLVGCTRSALYKWKRELLREEPPMSEDRPGKPARTRGRPPATQVCLVKPDFRFSSRILSGSRTKVFRVSSRARRRLPTFPTSRASGSPPACGSGPRTPRACRGARRGRRSPPRACRPRRRCPTC